MIDAKRKAQHPGEPWLWREEWAKRRVVHSHAKSGAFMLGFALVWNTVVAGVGWFAFTSSATPLVVRLIIAAFALLGLLMLWGGIRALLLGRRYGSSTLVLTTVPQKLGLPFRASVESQTIPDGEIHATVSCNYRPAASRTASRTLWSEERVIPRSTVQRTAAGGWSIPVQFTLPSDGYETEKMDEAGEVFWTLTLSIGKDKAAPDTRSDFVLPVFGRHDAEVEALRTLWRDAGGDPSVF